MTEQPVLDEALSTHPSQAPVLESEPNLSAKPESRTVSLPAQAPPSPSKLNVPWYRVGELAVVFDGIWYKTRILEAETSPYILSGPVKTRKEAGIPSYSKPKHHGKGWKKRASLAKKARESEEAMLMAERPDAAAYRVYKVHYEGYNTGRDEWLPAWKLKKADVFPTRDDTPGERSSAGPSTIVVQAGGEALPLAVPPRGRLFGNRVIRGRDNRQRGRTGLAAVTAPARIGSKGSGKSKSTPQPFKVDMPPTLRTMLVDDWEHMNRGMIVNMPCTPNIDEILAEFQTYLETEPLEDLCDPKVYASTITGGIKVYFEKAVGRNLLYPHDERSQFSGWRTQFKTGQHVTPDTTRDFSEAYGAIHLLRLLANFPQYMADSDLDAPSIHLISDYVNEFLRWLDNNRERIFHVEYVWPPDYFRTIAAIYGRPRDAAPAT